MRTGFMWTCFNVFREKTVKRLPQCFKREQFSPFEPREASFIDFIVIASGIYWLKLLIWMNDAVMKYSVRV